jgi:hypothetical protein
VKFVKKLRAEEEEQKRGADNKLKELKDKQCSDFFIRCDRRYALKALEKGTAIKLRTNCPSTCSFIAVQTAIWQSICSAPAVAA